MKLSQGIKYVAKSSPVWYLQVQLERNETAVEGSWGAENSPFD
jgi:hypothetical protein